MVLTESNSQYARAHGRLQKTIDAYNQQACQLERCREEYVEVEKVIRGLPKKLSHNIMVPLGSMAFFPGKLVHTNEITTLIGEDYFVERTVENSIKTLDARKELIDEQLENIAKQLKKLGATQNQSAEGETQQTGFNKDGYFEIREEIDDDEPAVVPVSAAPVRENAAPVTETASKGSFSDVLHRMKLIEEEEGSDSDELPVLQPERAPAEKPAPAPESEVKIRSPADIFTMMQQREASRAAPTGEAAAFSGTIKEREHAPPVVQEPPKRLSKFMQSRR